MCVCLSVCVLCFCLSIFFPSLAHPCFFRCISSFFLYVFLSFFLTFFLLFMFYSPIFSYLSVCLPACLSFLPYFFLSLFFFFLFSFFSFCQFFFTMEKARGHSSYETVIASSGYTKEISRNHPTSSPPHPPPPPPLSVSPFLCDNSYQWRFSNCHRSIFSYSV